MANNPFATTSDLESVWRTLTSDEATRATALLGFTSNQLRGLAGDRDLDTEASTDAVLKSNLTYVTAVAVRRSMQSPQEDAPLKSQSITAGPYTQYNMYQNPTGDIYFTKAELKLLGLSGQSTDSWITTDETLYETPSDNS